MLSCFKEVLWTCSYVVIIFRPSLFTDILAKAYSLDNAFAQHGTALQSMKDHFMYSISRMIKWYTYDIG